MRSDLPVWLAIAFLLSACSAQEKGPALSMPGNLYVSAPPDWRLANQTRDSIEIYVPLRKERKLPKGGTENNHKPAFVIASEAGMLITIEQGRDHAEAVRRLAEIASEYPEQATPLVIAGWPAIERRYRELMPQPGEDEVSDGNIQTSFATTAIAVGSTVVRFNTMFAPDAEPKLLDEALAIGRALRAPEGPIDVSRRELEEIRRMTKPPAASPTVAPEPGAIPRSRYDGGKQPGRAVQVQRGLGELEVASSNDGQHVVVATNRGFAFSDDFEATYKHGGPIPCKPKHMRR